MTTDFTRLFGIPDETFTEEIRQYIQTNDFHFRIIEGEDR